MRMLLVNKALVRLDVLRPRQIFEFKHRPLRRLSTYHKNAPITLKSESRWCCLSMDHSLFFESTHFPRRVDIKSTKDLP